MKKIILYTTVCIIFTIQCNLNRSQKFIIAVASSMLYLIEELKTSFRSDYGVEIEVVSGSSGKLSAQIQQGAPYDIFLSADMKYPQLLFTNNLTTDTPKIYAQGLLVLWTMKEIDLSKGLKIILNNNIKNIAIANPKNAPYGQEAINAINHYKLLNSVQSKLIYGESISQVNQYVVSKNCDIGFTSKSVVLSPSLKGKGKWIEIEKHSYNTIKQGVIITGYGEKNHPEWCKLFKSFLFSQKAKIIFEKYGYNTTI